MRDTYCACNNTTGLAMYVEPYRPDRLWTAEEYLEWESQQEFKNELIDNRVWVMMGASIQHSHVNMGLMMALHPFCEEQGYELLLSRMCLQIDPDSNFFFPDLSISHGKPRMTQRCNQHLLHDPVVVFEILSPHTEAMDRGRKRELYLQVESLQGYFMVSQFEPRIESVQRDGSDWSESEHVGLDDALVINAPACELPMREIYRHLAE